MLSQSRNQNTPYRLGLRCLTSPNRTSTLTPIPANSSRSRAGDLRSALPRQ